MSVRMNIVEACEEFGIPYDFIIQFIEEEWIVPSSENMLDEEDVARIRLIQELRVEFGVNDEGIPIILHLIDELNWLRLKGRGRSPDPSKGNQAH